MARGHLYLEYEGEATIDESHASRPGLKLATSVSFETAETTVRHHWQLDSTYTICFVQHDMKRNKDFAIPSVAWDWPDGEDQDLKVMFTKRATSTINCKDEKATPVRSTSPALTRAPRSTSPRHSPPPLVKAPLRADDDAIVPATPELSSDDSANEKKSRRAGGAVSSSSAEGQKGNGRATPRAQSRTMSREKLAAVADGERPASPPKTSSSGRPFPSLPTASSAAISPLTTAGIPVVPCGVFLSSSAGDSSQERLVHPPPPAAQLAEGSQDSFPTSSGCTDRSALAGRGRHDAVSPFRGDLNGSEEERKAEIRWGKQKESEPRKEVMTVDPALLCGIAPVPSHSPRRSSVGSDFCIGLVGDELAFVARSPERSRPPKSAKSMPARPKQQSRDEDVSMDEQSSGSQALLAVKEEEHSSPAATLFRPGNTSGSGSGSGSSRQALKHHSSATGETGSLKAFPLADAQARQTILQRTQVAPLPSAQTSPRGVKRKEPPITTPRSSPRRPNASTPASGLNKRLRTDEAPSSALEARNNHEPLGKKAKKGRASLLAMPSPSQPRFSQGSGKKKASGPSKARQSLPAVLTRQQYVELNAAERQPLPPSPAGARKSSRWQYHLRLPAAPLLSPRQQGPHHPAFIHTRRAIGEATEGLTLQFLFCEVEKITGWKRMDLKIRCLCFEKSEVGSGSVSAAATSTQGSGAVSSQADEPEMVERFAWGWDSAFIGFRDLEEWGLPSGALVDVDYFPYSPDRSFLDET